MKRLITIEVLLEDASPDTAERIAARVHADLSKVPWVHGVEHTITELEEEEGR